MSKTLDQERVLDARKRRPQESTPPTVQATPQAPTREAPRPDADRPVPITVTSPAAETRPVRRRRVLRAAVLILLFESAFIGIVRPPLAVPEMARTIDWVADHWPPRAEGTLDRLADRWLSGRNRALDWLSDHLPRPTTLVVPVPARPKALPPPTATDRAPNADLRLTMSAPRPPRSLIENPLAPRSTALEDTRKVLRLMESALQDAAHAVRTAQADSD